MGVAFIETNNSLATPTGKAIVMNIKKYIVKGPC